VRARVTSLAGDPSADVRLQVAIAVGKIEGIDPLPPLIGVAASAGKDRLIPAIVWQNLLPLLDRRGNQFLDLVGKTDNHRAADLAPIVTRALAYLEGRPGQDPSRVIALFKTLTEKAGGDAGLARQVLTSLAERIQTGEIPAGQLAAVRDWARPFVRRVLRGRPDDPLYLEAALLGATLQDPGGIAVARKVFASTEHTEEVRLRALAALIAGRDPELLDSVARVLTGSGTGLVPFRARVLATLGRLDDDRVAAVVLDRFPELEADLRSQAVGLLTQRVSWSKQLLRAVRDKKVPASALNVNQVRQLLAGKDPEVTRLVNALWGTVRPGRDPERKQVVARMRRFLRQQHCNPAAGRGVFRKLCGQCHKIYGEGADVGPDLTSAGRTSYDHLLTKVFDPNQFIKAGYQAVTVYTTRGRCVTGLVVEDNPRRLVLKTQGGKVETIPRAEVDSAVRGQVSLMPEGIEKLLSAEELADLFAFLTLDRPPGDPHARKIPGTPP
jgi:putative heme-binding domain-containing protein